MTDVRLKVAGDSSGATRALKDVSQGLSEMRSPLENIQKQVGVTSTAFKGLVANGLQAAITGLKDFIVEGVKAAAESEKLSRRVAFLAKEMAGAYDAQAEALSRKIGVDDDEVKQVQLLLLKYGVQKDAIEATTAAMFEFAAATGDDVTEATNVMLRAVEKGADGVRGLGLRFESTDDRAKDLALAVAEINGSLAGSAEAEAGTLAGSTRAAGVAFDDLKKAFGSLIGGFLHESGVISGITNSMRDLADAIKDTSNTTRTAAKDLGIEWLKDMGAPIAQRGDGMGEGFSFDDVDVVGRFKSRKSRSGDRDSAARDREAAGKKEFEDQMEVIRGLNKAEEQKTASFLASFKAEIEGRKKLAKERADIERETADESRALAKKESDEVAAILKAQSDMYRDAGVSVGVAFVNALGAELAELAAGGEFDIAGFMASILQTAFSVVGGIVGSIFPVVGTAGGAALGGAVGGAFGGIIKGFARAGKKHDGGWIERYHAGGWPGLGGDEQPAILQSGERVLSRREVGTMGGAGRVDAMASGGGMVTLNVSTIDARGVREFFGDQGGRGFSASIRTGRGDVARMFKGFK